MSAITSIGQSVTPQAQADAANGLADNFDTFLTLLTAQLQNQDPLSPLDSTEFVGQLVQFSSVEQQIAQNKNLETLVSQSAVTSSTAAVSFIGKEATLSTTSAPLQNGQANWSYALDRPAITTNVVISDSNGKVVFEAAGKTETGLQQFNWDGKDNFGNQLTDGAYSIQVTSTDDTGQSIPVSTSVKGIVTGVDFANGEPALLLGDIRVSFTDILSVRQASAV
ncbi:MAG: flagellar hook assembly protein FlgD [Robiginitomaculum sp.]|nr:flagellar hook assembly protein FlgD [Robiginitomaculum sp.]